MKRTTILIFILTCLSVAKAQNIQVYSPALINRTITGTTYVLRYAIVNHKPARLYEVTITNKLQGTAVQGIDYTLPANPYSRSVTPAIFTSVDATYIITLPTIDPCNTTDKTIILHIEAIPQEFGEATIKDSIKLTIHRTDHLTATQKKVAVKMQETPALPGHSTVEA